MILVDQHLRPVSKVHEFYGGRAFVEVGDEASWEDVGDLFVLPTCPVRFGRRRFLLAGSRIHTCGRPVVGGTNCPLHGGRFDFRHWTVINDDAEAWFTGPLAAARSEVWHSRNVMQTFTARSSDVYLFRPGGRYNPYDPDLLAEHGSAGSDDLDAAWRRALGALAFHH